ncbi:MAG: hypothetical protein IIT63_12665, partial [Prevotella sp.]|nr:hypothetical protein [Prevotella sp.]
SKVIIDNFLTFQKISLMIQTLWEIVHFGGKLRHFGWKFLQIQPFESNIIHKLNDFTQSI